MRRTSQLTLLHFGVIIFACLSMSSCAVVLNRFGGQKAEKDARVSELDVQGLVMEMADDYISALGEATYLSGAEVRLDPKARTLSQSFLRNGVGAAMDIAAGPNLNTALLDMVVLVSLQTWSYENHWMDAGIGRESGAASLERLRRAEKEIRKSAGRILSDEQLKTIDELVAGWIATNPDRTVVSLVRFDEFSNERRTTKEEHRKIAGNLLIDLNSATTTVDDARLLGERALWFSSRYPYILGEQMELTMYRLADQPEARDALTNLKSLSGMGTELREQAEQFRQDIAEQRQAAFAQLSAERKTSIAQAEEAIAKVIREATDETFERISTEKDSILKDIDARQAQLGSTLADLDGVISESTILARELTTTAGAFENVLKYFRPDSGRQGEALRMADVREAAIETNRAAEQLNLLLGNTNEIFLSGDWQNRVQELDVLAAHRVDQLFWRGLILVAILLGGMALLRFVPRRNAKGSE